MSVSSSLFSAPVLIVGQGLAGTALAWRLHERGLPFVIVDREELVTSSKIAAGLLTPVTGMRVSLSKGYPDQWPEALAFYRQLESQLRCSFFHESAHVRLFKNEVEQERWNEKKDREEFQSYVSASRLVLDDEVYQNPRGGFEMKQSGWLDTRLYLEASRRFFSEQDAYQQGQVSPDAVQVEGESVRWNGQKFSHVVWCTGWEAARHPLFDWVPFKSARGTILMLTADMRAERRVVHHGCWMVPLEDGRLRAGATYDSAFTDPNETKEKDLLTLRERLDMALKVPYQVLEKASAVRPIIGAQQTLVGRHPAHERVCFFNGLASKGALRAPHYARLLMEHMLDGRALPADVDLRSNL